MNSKLTLSIAVTSLFGVVIHTPAIADDISHSIQANSVIADTGGKCASGKCGTEKRYGQAKIDHNPQDKLVRARDGKCGVSGDGVNPDKSMLSSSNKFVGGVCGQ